MSGKDPSARRALSSIANISSFANRKSLLSVSIGVLPWHRFTDVLADYTGGIDLVTVGLLFLRDDPCRHGLVEEDIGSDAFCLTR